jgi:phosphoglycolate phosphatase-like HAD superfamily hydrolase
MSQSSESQLNRSAPREHSFASEVTNRLYESVDFAKHHERELVAAGVIVLGAAAIITHAGALAKLLSLGKSALTDGVAIGTDMNEVSALKREVFNAKRASFLPGVRDYVFDLDQTLVPTNDAYAVHQKTLIDQLAKHTGLDHEFVKTSVQDTEARVGMPLFANRLEAIKPIQDRFPGVDLNAKFPDIAPTVREAYRAALKPRQDTIDLLEHLSAAGKRMHVFTDSPSGSAMERVDASGLGKYFTNVFTGARDTFEDAPRPFELSESQLANKLVELTAERPKLDPHGYKSVLEHLDADGAHTLMTGDTNLLDVANAQKAGFRTAQALWYRQKPLDHALPDLILDSPASLQELVEHP